MRPLVLGLLALTAAGCASSSGGGAGGAAGAGGAGGGATPAAAAGRARRSPTLISTEEIAQRPDLNTALAIVENLRPQWTRGRGSINGVEGTNTTMPMIFLDEVPYGEVAVLASITSTVVREVRFISSSDATTRWGTGYIGGVIQVLTKK